jgi:hypothetical protein
MCKKTVLTVFLAVLFFPPLAAQDQSPWYIGFAGGYTNNSLYTSTLNRSFTAYENGHGFEFALPVRFRFLPWLAVQAEIQYVQKNYTWKRTESYNGYYADYTNQFLDFPLMAHFSLGGQRLRGFFNAGGYLGVWLSSGRKGVQRGVHPGEGGIVGIINDIDFNGKVEFDSSRDNRFDAGILAGLGVEYNFDTFCLFVEGTFNYGLTDLQKKYMGGLVPRINDTWVVRMGVLFNGNILNVFK